MTGFAQGAFQPLSGGQGGILEPRISGLRIRSGGRRQGARRHHLRRMPGSKKAPCRPCRPCNCATSSWR